MTSSMLLGMEVDYEKYDPGSPPGNGSLGCTLLMCLNAQNRFEGKFRFCLSDGGELAVSVPLVKVFHPLPPEFSHLSLRIATSSRDIDLQENSAATAWIDIVDMIRDGSAQVVNTNSDDLNEDTAPLVNYLVVPSPKMNVGASLRWMVTMRPDGMLTLELQLLPVPARLLKKLNLEHDNAGSVLLRSFLISSPMFEDTEVDGPVPHLFTPVWGVGPTTDLPTLGQPFIKDIRRLFKKLMEVKHLSLEEATSYMQNHQGPAKRIPVFPENVQAAAPSKRPPLQPHEDSSSGNYTNVAVYRRSVTPIDLVYSRCA